MIKPAGAGYFLFLLAAAAAFFSAGPGCGPMQIPEHGMSEEENMDFAEAPGTMIYPREIFLVAARNAEGGTVAGIILDGARAGSIAVPRGTGLHGAISETGEFSVNYPSAGMEQIVLYCLGEDNPETDRLKQLGMEIKETGGTGAPLIKNSVRKYQSRVEDSFDAPGATFFKGRIVNDFRAEKKDGAERLYLFGSRQAPVLAAAPAHRHYPERIILAVSGGGEKKQNAMVVGTHITVSENPLIFALWIGKTRHSYGLIEKTGEFVLSIPGTDMVKEVIVCGTMSGADINKFEYLDMKTAAPSMVDTPLLDGAAANYECRVIKTLDWGSHTIFIGRCVKEHIPSPGKTPLFYLGGPWDSEASYGPVRR